MGIKYTRSYRYIIQDLSQALHEVDEVYEFVEMPVDTWTTMSQQEQDDCLKTISDDIFYALDFNPTQYVGQGKVQYDRHNNILKVFDGSNCIHIIELMKS
ncbi:MAG: hypothetical protein ACOCZ3_00770 [Bacillota bacterium]